MPKVGMEPVRKKQLIEATLEVMAEVGYHGTTISLISKRAGLSSGIISHYFGDKQGLIEATMRHLLDALKITQRIDDPLHRLQCINHKRLERNLAFSYRKLLQPEQVKNAAASTSALIDGYWLRYSMGSVGNGDFSEAVARCKQYVRDLVAQYGR